MIAKIELTDKELSEAIFEYIVSRDIIPDDWQIVDFYKYNNTIEVTNELKANKESKEDE